MTRLLYCEGGRKRSAGTVGILLFCFHAVPLVASTTTRKGQSSFVPPPTIISQPLPWPSRFAARTKNKPGGCSLVPRRRSTNPFHTYYQPTSLGSTHPARLFGRLNSQKRNSNNHNDDSDSNDENKNIPFDLVNGLARIVTLPTPLISSFYYLPLGYPFALGGLVGFVLPPMTSLLLLVLFVGFSVLGQSFFLLDSDDDYDDDDDEKDVEGADDLDDNLPVNLVALIASILSSLLLAPSVTPSNGVTSASTSSTILNSDPSSGTAVAVVGIVALLAGLALMTQKDRQGNTEEDFPVERQRMDLWDDEFQQQQQQNKDLEKK